MIQFSLFILGFDFFSSVETPRLRNSVKTL